MPDRTTLNLIAAVVSLLGSIRSYRQASGKFSKLKAGIGLATSAVFVYRVYQERQADGELSA